MKALSLWQPWASAVAVGAKRIDTHSWPTKYRGPVAIHAARRQQVYDLIHYQCCWNWCGALGFPMGTGDLINTLPFGAIIAVANLVDCRPTGSFTIEEIETPREPDGLHKHPIERALLDPLYRWTERQLGDFSIGRYGWVLENVRKLDEPIPYLGKQGLFDIPPGLIPD